MYAMKERKRGSVCGHTGSWCCRTRSLWFAPVPVLLCPMLLLTFCSAAACAEISESGGPEAYEPPEIEGQYESAARRAEKTEHRRSPLDATLAIATGNIALGFVPDAVTSKEASVDGGLRFLPRVGVNPCGKAPYWPRSQPDFVFAGQATTLGAKARSSESLFPSLGLARTPIDVCGVTMQWKAASRFAILPEPLDPSVAIDPAPNAISCGLSSFAGFGALDTLESDSRPDLIFSISLSEKRARPQGQVLVTLDSTGCGGPSVEAGDILDLSGLVSANAAFGSALRFDAVPAPLDAHVELSEPSGHVDSRNPWHARPNTCSRDSGCASLPLTWSRSSDTAMP